MNGNKALIASLALAAAVAGPAGAAERIFEVHERVGDATAVRTMDADGHRAALAGDAVHTARASVAGAGPEWSALGPFGGDVRDVAASPTVPTVILAGTSDGSFNGSLYRSQDGGQNWQRVPDLAGQPVNAISFSTTGVAYVATANGVWSSTDDGVAWTHHDLGIGANQNVQAVTVDPGDADVVWAGIADALGAQTVNLVRSGDGGQSWVDRTPPLSEPMTGSAIAIEPSDPDTVIAGFAGWLGGGAVWTSQDGGATWTDRSAGLPAYPVHAVDYDGDRLLVGGGQLFGSQYFGLYASDDLGATWTALHDAGWPLPVVTGIAVDPADAEVILVSTDGAGVNRSDDGGATWQTGIGQSGNLSLQSVRFAPGSSTDLFLGATSLGVFVSDDGGDHFESSSTGIAEFSLYSAHVNPLDPDELAVAFQGSNNGGVLSSTDGGATWQLEDVPGTRYSHVRFSPDGVLHALSSGPSSIAPEGLYRRNPDASWTSLGPDQGDLFESDLGVIRFSSNDPDRIWLGGSDFGVAGFEQTVWFSDDGGATWSKQFEGFDNDFTTDIEVIEDGLDQRLVAVYDGFRSGQEGGAIASGDGGATWTYAEAGLPAFARTPRLCASPTAPETVFLLVSESFSESRIYRTDTGSAPWTATAWSGPRAIDIACDRIDDQVLYIAQIEAPLVARSDDQGASFQAYDTGLESAGAPRELVQSDAGERLLLATGGGAYALVSGDDDDVIFANGFEQDD